MQKETNEFPTGWDEQRVRELIEHYESQTDEEAVAEHETALSRSIPMSPEGDIR